MVKVMKTLQTFNQLIQASCIHNNNHLIKFCLAKHRWIYYLTSMQDLNDIFDTDNQLYQL